MGQMEAMVEVEVETEAVTVAVELAEAVTAEAEQVMAEMGVVALETEAMVEVEVEMEAMVEAELVTEAVMEVEAQEMEVVTPAEATAEAVAFPIIRATRQRLLVTQPLMERIIAEISARSRVRYVRYRRLTVPPAMPLLSPQA